MSIYTAPLSQLTTADLQQLVSDNAVENVRLEFKSAAPNKYELLKKLSSFANTFGSFLVIGAAANSGDGHIQDLPGLDAEPGYKQRVVQWCFDGASPPLVAEVSDPFPLR
jgi:predicted HTH transcriptional regulator